MPVCFGVFTLLETVTIFAHRVRVVNRMNVQLVRRSAEWTNIESYSPGPASLFSLFIYSQSAVILLVKEKDSMWVEIRCCDCLISLIKLLVVKTGLELPPGMPGISPALVTLVPGTAVAKDIPAGDTIIPG